MTRAQALTAARIAGFENDTAYFTRLIVEQRVNREAMHTAWRAGRQLAVKQPDCPCVDCLSQEEGRETP